MNKVFLIGNLTRDPEMRSTQSGVPVCNFSIAVNRRFRNAQTGQQETDFQYRRLAPARRALRPLSDQREERWP